jgi:hypothetical protein
MASNGYSARVRIELRVGALRIPVAQTGGGQLIFDRPTTLPASEGEVVMHIDGHEHRWRVTSLRSEDGSNRRFRGICEPLM